MSAEVFVDAALFMGMNCRDETVRVACKNVFVDRLVGGVAMSLEQVGRCDDLVWRYPRDVQDAYYPFMDNLQSVLPFRRISYDETDMRAVLDGRMPHELPVHERLALAMVCNRGGTLYSVSPRLGRHLGLPVCRPAASVEAIFPGELERLYRESLELRVEVDQL
jgi:Family of unknown function (DUF6190)